MAKSKMELLSERLADDRSKRVLFVAHCILNENVRFQGGAFRKAINEDIVEQALAAGVGLVQMPCPEQRAWGGVLRPWLWLMLGSKGTFLYRLRRPLSALLAWYTKRFYRKLARGVVRVMADYVRSRYEVVGVVGIEASPSCGVNSTLDPIKGLEYIADKSASTLVRESFNREAIAAGVVPGQGIFVEALRAHMRRQGIDVPFFEDLVVAKMKGTQPPPRIKLPLFRG